MNIFVARQPIFDQKLEVFAYELLFRLEGQTFFDCPDGDKATSKVVADSFFNLGIKLLTEGKRAFINFTRNLLLDEVPTILPRELVAVEVLETLDPDEQLLTACRNLKQSGYTLVLDDFNINTRHNPLVDLADIIKVDFQKTTPEERTAFLHSRNFKKIKLLAEKVETHQQFEQAVQSGFSLFQGYFFCKPVILSGKELPSYKLNYINIISETSKSEPDLDRLEEIIKRDVSFSYKLLRCVNSAAFGLRVKVESIRHAMILMGNRELKKWVSLIALQGLAEDKPMEIMTVSIFRARFCELLTPEIGWYKRESDLFLMGLFSLIDAFVDRPLDEILAELPISDDIKDALLQKGGPLIRAYDLVLAYERGRWRELSQIAKALKMDEEKLPAIALQSLEWARMVFEL